MIPTVMTARVTDQRMLLVNEPLIASGGVDVLQIRFEFCGLWDGGGKTAVFYRDPESVYHVPIVDSLATVPHELLTEEGHFYFGVMGAASNIRTTEVLRVKVVDGAPTEATANHEELTPDIYQQILSAYGEMEQKCTEAMAQISPLAAYPVGAIYMSVNATSPAGLFGGTWQRLKDRFLLAAGDNYEAGETGGAAEVTLTEAQMPSHQHFVGDLGSETNWGVIHGNYVGTNSGYGIESNGAFITKPAGGGEAHENMPPYLAVYMWVRTA